MNLIWQDILCNWQVTYQVTLFHRTAAGALKQFKEELRLDIKVKSLSVRQRIRNDIKSRPSPCDNSVFETDLPWFN